VKGDPDTHSGTRRAIVRAWNNPLLTDAAADAAFASSLRRLREVPGTHKEDKQ
jgi:hypothetical protein